MTKKPKPEAKPNWSSFTKAELIRTIKALDKRQTKLLNELAEQNRRVASFMATETAKLGVALNVAAHPEEPELLNEAALESAEIVTDKTTAAPTNIPPTSERIEMSAESIGFTLKSDAQTLRDIEPRMPWETALPNPYEDK